MTTDELLADFARRLEEHLRLNVRWAVLKDIHGRAQDRIAYRWREGDIRFEARRRFILDAVDFLDERERVLLTVRSTFDNQWAYEFQTIAIKAIWPIEIEL